MRIDCGNSREAKHRLREMWHPWFAWFPVWLGPHYCVWLEVVERRGRFSHDSLGGQWCFDYRPAQGVMNWWRTWA